MLLWGLLRGSGEAGPKDQSMLSHWWSTEEGLIGPDQAGTSWWRFKALVLLD